jgi:hypothetical protein
MAIIFSKEDEEYIELQAVEKGYDSAVEYILALIDADDWIDDPEEEGVDLEAEFREAWHAAMTGEGLIDAREAMAQLRAELEQEQHGDNS